jgi:hypothetical protein
MKRKKVIAVGALVGAVIAALVVVFWPAPPPKILFAAYGDSYREKPDFAAVEHQMPLRRADLIRLTPNDLKALNQEQLDQLYARLTAGPIPDGPFDGYVLRPDDAPLDRIAETVGGLQGLAVKFRRGKLRMIMNTLWQGKVFYRNERVLRNRIENLAVLQPLIETNLANLPKVTVGGKDAWLLFPAKVYCGQSLVDGRRESIVVDYAFADDIEGYREMPDFLAGRRGFKVRDELRMVRPGFYLGRAYLDRVFALNFTLTNGDLAERDGGAFLNGRGQEDCWSGTQRFAAAR